MTETKPGRVLSKEYIDEIKNDGYDVSFGVIRELVVSHESLRSALGVAREALEAIWKAPNGENEHHPQECDLRRYGWSPENDDEDLTCTCGYWASEYPQFKIEAGKALARIDGMVGEKP